MYNGKNYVDKLEPLVLQLTVYVCVYVYIKQLLNIETWLFDAKFDWYTVTSEDI